MDSEINYGSNYLLGMLSCVCRLFSWPHNLFQSSLFIPEKLQFHINSRRLLSFLYISLSLLSPLSKFHLNCPLKCPLNYPLKPFH